MALTNSRHNEIMRSYEQKQFINRDRLLERFDKIYKEIPELKELDESVSAISVTSARKMLEGDNDALGNLKAELHSLTDRRTLLLTSHGYPADYLEPVYHCPDCQDTGYVNNRKCHCFKKAVIDLLYTQSNLSEILMKENFDTFKLDYYSSNFIDRLTGKSSLETMKNNVAVCRQFINNFDAEPGNLLFYGSTGVGKTFLSNCIARELIERAYSVIYFTVAELFEVSARNTFGKDPEAQDVNEYVIDCDLLIIDDLGTELANSFTNSRLFTYLNERILRQKATIISTNLSLDDIKSIYSERIFSRISSNYTMLRFVGDDIRIQKKLMNREAN